MDIKICQYWKSFKFRGIRVFRTDEQGTIVAKNDGTVPTVEETPQEPKVAAPTQEISVHITDTGGKYHNVTDEINRYNSNR